MGKTTGFMEYERIEEGYPAPAERVKQCKKDGLIDAFIYNSTSERYLSALLDSV